MTRLNADEMRRRFISATENNKIDKKFSQKILTRRNKLWKLMYLEAINGETNIYEIVNLANEDIRYFSDLGFEIIQTDILDDNDGNYKEKKIRLETLISEKVKIQAGKSRELEVLEKKIQDYDMHSVDYSRLKEWLAFNDDLFQEFFLDLRADIYDFDQIDDLKEIVIEKQKGVPKMIAKSFFKEFIEIIKWTKNTFDPNYDYSDATDLSFKIYGELSSLTEAIESLEDELEEPKRIFKEYGLKAKTLHDIFWVNKSPITDASNEIFNINSLSWLSSHKGQSCLQWIEGEIKRLADKGQDNIIFKTCSEDNILTLHIKNEIQIKNSFCSYFDLCQTMKSLGYKISSTVTTKFCKELTVRW